MKKSNLVDFNTLKPFKKSSYSSKVLGRVFPQYLISTFTTFLVITNKGTWERLVKDSNKLFNFTINLGLCIERDDFTRIGDIIIEYFEESFYVQDGIRYYVILGHKEKKEFLALCKTFEGRTWDEILDELCDGLNKLSFSGKVNNISIYGAD